MIIPSLGDRNLSVLTELRGYRLNLPSSGSTYCSRAELRWPAHPGQRRPPMITPRTAYGIAGTGLGRGRHGR